MSHNAFRPRSALLALAAAATMASAAASPLPAQGLDVPYVPTPPDVVDRMLEMADVGPGDYVIDLGSGDGRIVIAAAERGAVGHGVELDPVRIEDARANAEEAGVDDRIMFLEEDIFETDVGDASVVTMYLLNSVNRKLRPRLLETLEPGTRIVSHSFDMGEWEPDAVERMTDRPDGSTRTVYLWVVPARVAGAWSWSVGDASFRAEISQRFQEIDVTVRSGDESWTVEEAVLSGERLSLVLSRGPLRYVLSGRVRDGAVEGTAQRHRGGEALDRVEWTGSRR